MGLSYIICTAPRTGSTLLAEALKATGCAGRPAEYFDIHAHNEQYWIRTLGIRNDAEYIEKVVEAGTTSNGVFGLKVHFHQLRAVHAKLLAAAQSQKVNGPAMSVEALLRARFGEPRYIWLMRRNKVAEAISYYRAAKTGLWRSLSAEAAHRNAMDAALAFDFAAIDQYVRLVEDFDRGWESYFRQHRLKVLALCYEDLVKDYESTVRAVLNYLGIATQGLSIDPPRLGRQADTRSNEWERRYIAMRHGQGAATATAASEGKAESLAGKRRQRAMVARAASPNAENAPLPFIAYALDESGAMPLEPAPSGRDWMDTAPRRFAYRCLPLLMANQAGWLINNPHKFMVTWNGGLGADALKVEFFEKPKVAHAASHFGGGILTVTVGYLFRTPPGYNLYVRGPANLPKDGIAPLEGIVETDWSEATFTMNWQVTRRNHPIVFEEGEPIAMVSPMRRGELERFRPEIHSIAQNPELKAGYEAWTRSRQQHNAGLKVPNSEAQLRGWERHYMQGVTVTDRDAPEHQTSLKLEPFADKRK